MPQRSKIKSARKAVRRAVKKTAGWPVSKVSKKKKKIQVDKVQARTKVPDLGISPELILKPEYRGFFGRIAGDPFTAYGLLLRTLCDMFYGDQLRAISAQDGEQSEKRPQKKNIRIEEWRRYFTRAIYDQVMRGERRLDIENHPKEDEEPDSTIIRITASGKAALMQYKAEGKTNQLKMMVKLMEEHLNELYPQVVE